MSVTIVTVPSEGPERRDSSARMKSAGTNAELCLSLLVTTRIHDHEADTSESMVRSLLRDQCSALAENPLSYLQTSGTDNAMWRVQRGDGVDLVVRLPRTDGAATSVAFELTLLPQLNSRLRAHTPVVHHAGSATDAFPYQWAVLEWLDGIDAWTGRDLLIDNPTDATKIAEELAQAVVMMREMSNVTDLPERAPGQRGGPLVPLLHNIERWLTDSRWNAEDILDVRAVRRVAAQCAEASETISARAFVHGDLIPGNLLIADARLAAIIDWGGAGFGDPAQDLNPAWAIFEGPARDAFREAVDADEETWLRAKAFELEHAIGGVLYYRPRKHPLGDVMARTLDRILADA